MLTRTPYRLHCPPLRKFHATRIHFGKKVKAVSPRPKDKKATAWKRNEGKRSRNESFPASIKLSSLLRRHNQSAQHEHVVGEESTRSRASLNGTRLSRGLAFPNGKLSSTSASTKRVAHPRASENDGAGGSPHLSNLSLFIRPPRTASFG